MARKLICALAVIYMLTGCYYDSAEEIYGTGVCNTTNVTYSNSIGEVINRNACLGCHTGVAPAGSFKLENYNDVKAKALELRNGTSVLLGALQHLPNFVAMPQGLSQISQCDINKIKAWIDAGTPQ